MNNTDSAYIYGRNAVIEALESKSEINKIFIQFGATGDIVNRIFAMAEKSGIHVSKVDKQKYKELEIKAGARANDSQGVIALKNITKYIPYQELANLENNPNPIIIALDEITDPHNLGAIARTAECAGATAILLSEKNSAPITPVAIKASAGALEHIPVSKAGSMPRTLEYFKEKGFKIIGTDMKTETNYTDDLYSGPIVIVIGSEGRGMRHVITRQCDSIVKIPLHGKINSLNASVSAAIVIYEAVRQRTK